MTCKKFEKHLAAWIGGYLSPQQAEQMQQHYLACSAAHPQGKCRDLFAAETAIHEALTSVAAKKLPSHIEYQILDKVRTLSPARSRYKRGWKRLQLVQISFAMIFSICLGVIATGHIWGRDDESSVTVSDYLQMESSGLTDLYAEYGETQ